MDTTVFTAERRHGDVPAIATSPHAQAASRDDHGIPVASVAALGTASTSSPRPSPQWMRIQNRARALHAWETKYGVEEAAVRQLEAEAQVAMEATLGRKAALMEDLRHLCREHALLSKDEATFRAEEDALQAQSTAIDGQSRTAAAQALVASSTNPRRRQELHEAQREFSQTQARHADTLQSLTAEIRQVEESTACAEVQAQLLVQLIADKEHNLAFEAESIRGRQRDRLATLERQIGHLLTQLQGVERH